MNDTAVKEIRTNFKQRLFKVMTPERETKYMKHRKKVDLAPRLYNSIFRQRKGTSSLINHINKGIYKPSEKIQDNWKIESRRDIKQSIRQQT